MTHLQKHLKVDSATARARLVRFGSASLDLEVFAYVLLTDNAAFLEVQEEILLRIMDIIGSAGTSIALPPQTTYLAKDWKLDGERQAAADHIRKQKQGAVAS